MTKKQLGNLYKVLADYIDGAVPFSADGDLVMKHVYCGLHTERYRAGELSVYQVRPTRTHYLARW